MAPVCLLQDGRNRKYSAAASCLFLGGLCVTCIRSKTVTNVSLNLCANRLELPPRGLSASSILKTDPRRSKNSKVNVDMFPRTFSLFWSIATKKHMQAYIFLVLAQCQKQHSKCVAVSIKEYRTFGRDQCREHLFYRCFLVVTFQDRSFVRGKKVLTVYLEILSPGQPPPFGWRACPPGEWCQQGDRWCCPTRRSSIPEAERRQQFIHRKLRTTR